MVLLWSGVEGSVVVPWTAVVSVKAFVLAAGGVVWLGRLMSVAVVLAVLAILCGGVGDTMYYAAVLAILCILLFFMEYVLGG